jgi:hypothetical protein
VLDSNQTERSIDFPSVGCGASSIISNLSLFCSAVSIAFFVKAMPTFCVKLSCFIPIDNALIAYNKISLGGMFLYLYIYLSPISSPLIDKREAAEPSL